MNSTQQPTLNLAGQMILTGIASLAVNTVVHPLGTIKNCLMALPRQPLPRTVNGLYRGYTAICATDAAVFGIAYVTQDSLLHRLSLLGACIAAGIVSSPAVCIGESLMANRQVNQTSYRDAIRIAFRPAGLVATISREVPYNVAVFLVAPYLQSRLRLRNQSDAVNQAVAGSIAGAGAGWTTTGIDRIKTIVQTSSENVSIAGAARSIMREEGMRGLLFRGGLARSFYIALSGGIMNVVYNTVPRHLALSFGKNA